ncbi:hypothetical protein [Flavobacterium sp. CLA17]|uniref:hypothetical protein n=1 Tax=Flavobacterium sp. CLA17 TaxID=2724135 RepID=UPI0014912DF4|nr:hypothetical protein [Flavobacterium sp. CLA17]QSB25476.1 hypothetical protein HAV12_013955 [Flavobacterium sp. CLA17]
MKNLFLTCTMLLIFGTATTFAQETPKKTTQSTTRTTTDTIIKKKGTNNGKKHPSTHKADTLSKQTTKTKMTKTKTTSPIRSKDSVGTSRP